MSPSRLPSVVLGGVLLLGALLPYGMAMSASDKPLHVLDRPQLVLTPLPRQPPTILTLRRGLARLPFVFDRLYQEHFVASSAVQAMALCGVSDVASQRMHGMALDAAHVAAMAVIAAILSGALSAIWMRWLEEHIPGSDEPAVLAKTVVDCAPLPVPTPFSPRLCLLLQTQFCLCTLQTAAVRPSSTQRTWSPSP